MKKKIISNSLIFLLSTSLLAFTFKKIGLRRIIANPLKDEAEIAKSDRYWKIAIYNLIMMGTAGTLASSFYASELNKIILYQKYEK